MVGISTDPQEVSDRFRESLDLPFVLVSDHDATIASAYGVKWPLVKIASRVTFMIGRDRRVARAHKSARNIESHLEMVRDFDARS